MRKRLVLILSILLIMIMLVSVFISCDKEKPKDETPSGSLSGTVIPPNDVEDSGSESGTILPPDDNKEGESGDEKVKITGIQGGTVNGLELNLEIGDTVEYVALSDMITTSKDCSWQLYMSPTATAADAIVTKMIVPKNGANAYYIVVTSSDGKINRTYTLNVWKNYFAKLFFYVDDILYDTEEVLTHTSYGVGPSYEKEGYNFLGWNCNNHYVVGDVSFDATLAPRQYTITFDINGGNSLESNTQQVTYDSVYTLPTPTREGYAFAGWYNGSTLYTNGTWNTASNLILTANWQVDEEYHNYEYDSSNNLVSFTYGEYPQTIKDSFVVIDESSLDSRGYYLGSDGAYYAKVTAKPYASGYTYSNGTTITSGNVDYFKVEPIKWKVLYNTDGTYLVMSDLILDAQCYYYSKSSRSGATDYQGNSTTSTVYANNYKYSDIRTFLNTTFINKAFISEEQDLIKITTVDNSASSTGYSSNSYACEDTQDKIFLLSLSEVTNKSYGFSGKTDRYAKGTDYAKARGLYVYTTTGEDYTGNSYWWLRSPEDDLSDYSRRAHCDGYFLGGYVGVSSNGVRPALNINL